MPLSIPTASPFSLPVPCPAKREPTTLIFQAFVVCPEYEAKHLTSPASIFLFPPGFKREVPDVVPFIHLIGADPIPKIHDLCRAPQRHNQDLRQSSLRIYFARGSFAQGASTFPKYSPWDGAGAEKQYAGLEAMALRMPIGGFVTTRSPS